MFAHPAVPYPVTGLCLKMILFLMLLADKGLSNAALKCMFRSSLPAQYSDSRTKPVISLRHEYSK